MPDHDLTQVARSPLLLLDYAEREGLNRVELMRAASLSAEDLADPDSRIPVASMHKLWRSIMALDPNPVLGLMVGSTVTAKRMGLVGYAMYFSDNLFDALSNLSRYGRLLSDAAQFRVIQSHNSVSLRVDMRPNMVALRHPIECVFALFITIAREITQSKIVPLTVRLPSPLPRSVDPYRTAFGTAVSFESPVAEMSFTKQKMEMPVKAHDAALSGYLDDLAEDKLRALGELKSEIIDRVRRGIWSVLQNGKPSLHRTAATIGMSSRTLQRRLGERETSFSAVLEELRRELSVELAVNRGFAVGEAAFLLGYSEPSAYQRALRRWRNSHTGNSQAS